MGGSNSTLTITDGFASILSDQPVSAEVLNQLLANTLTNTEMQKALPLSLLRKLRHYYTHNFAAVLHKCIAEVSTMSERRNKANESSTGDAGLTETAVNAFLTAMQVLRRLLPVALESCDTIIDEEQTQLREHHVSEASQTSPADDSHPRGGDVAPNPTLSGSIPARTLATQQFLKLFFEEGRTCNDANLDERFPLLPKQEQLSDATTALPTNLGSHLVCALVECCFIRGLTLRTTRAIPSTPVPSLAHGEVDNRFVWSDGIGSNEPLDYTRTRSSASRVSTRMNATRRDVLNTLLSLVSSPLYHQCGYRDTLFMEPLLSASSVPLAPTLAASMLNTIFNYIPYGSLPYTSYFVHEEEGVVVASARLLCATMCYVGIPLDARKGSELANGSPTMAHSNPAVDDSSTAEHGNSHSAEQDDPTVGTSGAPERLTRDDHQSSPDAPPNVAPGQQVRIVHCIRKLVHDITLSESKFIAECFIDVIGLRAYSNQTYLPDSQRNFTSHDEFMMLLWKLIDLSPSVSTQFGCNTRSLSYLVPVLDYGLDARNSANYVHRLQLVLFMLLRLSEVRSFGVHCNKVIGEFIPFPFPKLPATSTYHDLIVVSMCLILEASESALVPLMPSCSVVITNLAPYITQLGNCASLKLTNVFVKASNRCLRSTDTSDRGLSAVNQNVMVNTCEAIASLLQYQESGSRYLLASLVDHRHVVNRLRDAYIVNRTKSFSIPMTSFLIATLDAAVSVAVPFVAVEFNPSFSATAEDSSSSGSQSPRSAAEIAETAAATAIHVAAVAEKLTSITLVGMLPTPHPLVTRKFHQTRLVENWATITFWANLYTRSAAGWMGDRASVKLLHFS